MCIDVSISEITLLYNAGVDVKSAQAFLGHKNIAMTLDIYTHLQKKVIIKEIQIFNDYMETNYNF